MRKQTWLIIVVVLALLAAACQAAPVSSPTPGTPAATDTPAAGTPTPAQPTDAPTDAPTEQPTEEPTAEPTAQPEAVLPSTPTGYAELDQALAPAPDGGTQAFAGTTVSIQAQWPGAEGVNFANTIAAFQAATGITIQFDQVPSNHEVVLRTRIEGGVPPDLAQIAQPAAMASYARQGQLIDLAPFMDNDRFRDDFAALLNLIEIDGGIYGVPWKVDVKSTVWYPLAAFEAADYQVPTTWDELIALSNQIAADGANPWCISIEHGAATGWVGTDWIEDILLRTAPREVYDQWINHDIPFDDPQIKNAFDLAGQIFFGENYAYGGPTYINSTWVGQTQDPAFEDPPGCYMHKQALWYSDFFPPREDPAAQAQPGTDMGVFYFPPIDPQYGNPVLGSGDVFMMLVDRPEVRAVAQFLATPEAAYAWIQAAGITSANGNAPAEWYEGNYKASVSADIIGNGTTFAFDASDLMPPVVGQGSFWNGIVEWVTASGSNTDQVLADVESSWPAN